MVASPSLRAMVNNSGVSSSSSTMSIDRASASAAAATESMTSAPTGAIVGGIFGFLALLMIASAALLFVRRKRRRELKRSRAANMTRVEPSYQDYTDEPLEPAMSSPAVMTPMASVVAPMATAPINTTVMAPIMAPIVAPTAKNEPLGLYTVIATYTPTLSDELEIEPGDSIELLTEYDDGWCQGINLSKSNAKGVFPRHCIDQAPPLHPLPSFEKERTKRVSSMYVMQSK
ncbi:hypothetical protein BY458DRAFT_503813 [Sporodiniella umbellata]|nr:hypothetical protein BY458DRAFT_503813 [Sporodiniella umbellata]